MGCILVMNRIARYAKMSNWQPLDKKEVVFYAITVWSVGCVCGMILAYLTLRERR